MSAYELRPKAASGEADGRRTNSTTCCTCLAAFDKYEIVGMSEAHGMKDVDDFILSLIRNPAFPERVNDVVVECGN